MQYKNITGILDSASEIAYFKVIGCIPRCSYTKYRMKPIYDSNYNKIEYLGGKDDGANIDIAIGFISSEGI